MDKLGFLNNFLLKKDGKRQERCIFCVFTNNEERFLGAIQIIRESPRQCFSTGVTELFWWTASFFSFCYKSEFQTQIS